MAIDRIVLAFAGFVILASLALSQIHHANWLWLAAFASLAPLSARPCAAPVGANLLQSAFTGFCPLAKILKAAGARPGVAFE